MQAALWQCLHAELARDRRTRPCTDRAHRVTHTIFQLHLLAALEERLGIT
jgi:hypothetical protein